MDLFFALLFTVITFNLHSQDSTSYIKKNAIKLIRSDSLDNSLYTVFSDFRYIMIGEMHGTNEPAKFTMSLAQLLTSNGDSVQLGLEIPSEEMTKFLIKYSDTSIYSSEFFSKEAIDGRENYVWAQLIATLNKNRNVKIFFFDVNKEDYKISDNRDSLMYIKIKKQIQKYPEWKLITLSGNIHNMLQPYKDIKTMACYLKSDKELSISDKLCSINHLYTSGAMYNNIGKGLELTEIKNLNSIYSKSVSYDNYLLLYSDAGLRNYSGIFYTKYVTAAKIINK